MAEPAMISAREERILGIIETARGKRAKFRDERITMAHGAGGKATQTLIEGLFVPLLSDAEAVPAGGATPAAGSVPANGDGATAAPTSGSLAEMADAAMIDVDGIELAFTTDSYVVRPLRFPGGSIGELAVNGTVNDLAVSGARPLALSLSLVLEEGLAADELRGEIEAIAQAARTAGVSILTGDTKVVERGHADGMYVCTAGIGRRDPRARLAPGNVRPGDRILLSGGIGEHGMAIMLARGEFELDAAIASDTASLWPAVDALLEVEKPAHSGGDAIHSHPGGPGEDAIHCLRDATRGGVASVLNELARAACVAMVVREETIPVAANVAGAAEILGIDPLYVANEGKLLAFVAPEQAQEALAALRAVPGCELAAEIGEVRTEPPGMVLVQTSFGGRRVMDQLVGDPLPRIC
jgi:hydrogenase expression/formation protein HypE